MPETRDLILEFNVENLNFDNDNQREKLLLAYNVKPDGGEGLY